MGDDSTETGPGFARRAWGVATPCLAGLGVTLLAFGLLHGRLPARMPTHFGASGADAFGSPGEALAGYLVIFAVQTVLFLVWTLGGDDPRAGARWAVPVAWGSSAGTTYLLCGLLTTAATAPDGRHVAVSAGQLAVAAALGLLTTAGTLLLRRRRGGGS
jgi:hypothetical protein